MKIILAGSPIIAVATFRKIIQNFDVVAIITQPDKPQGRGMKLQQTKVADLANEYNIKVFKPKKIINIIDELKLIEFDQLVTFAFGQWIPTSILNLGKNKPLNIHGSILPKYRGAAPIHHAILNGEKEIGITLIEMIKEMDAGDMFFKASCKIDSETTTGEGFEIISKLACENIVSWLKEINSSNIKPIKQSSNFSIAPKIKKEFGELDSTLSMYETKRKIKSLNPFPCAFKFIDGKRVKIFNVSNVKIPNSIEIKCLDGTLFANDYQWESKKRVLI